MLQGVRPAFVADQAELAYNKRGPDCEWGLALGDRATEAIIDTVGMIFVPLYQIIGPTSIVDISILVTTAVGRQGHPNGALAELKRTEAEFGQRLLSLTRRDNHLDAPKGPVCIEMQHEAPRDGGASGSGL
jgi:hypothetical protein